MQTVTLDRLYVRALIARALDVSPQQITPTAEGYVVTGMSATEIARKIFYEVIQ